MKDIGPTGEPLLLIPLREGEKVERVQAIKLFHFFRTHYASHIAVRLFQHCEPLRGFYMQRENQISRMPLLALTQAHLDQGYTG